MPRLPERMEQAWLLTARGLSEADAARELGTSRQAVNKAVRDARARLAAWFVEMTESLNADLIRMDAVRGLAVMRSRQLALRIYAIYVPGRGLRVIFGMEPLCPGRDGRRHCREVVEAARALGLIEGLGEGIEDAVRGLIRVMES